ncbi:MAG: Twitching motility protein PilT, partial [uncultured Ramlibacter sp.]
NRPVPRQPVRAAHLVRGGVPGHPAHHQAAGRARRAQLGGAVRAPGPRPGAGDRPDRFRQDHDAGIDARPGEPQPGVAHRDDRGPDRVPAPAQAQPGQPAGGRHRHRVLPAGAQARAAPGPGHHPGRRASRPGDHRDRPDGGGDRSPGAGDPAHAERHPDDRPDHRHLPPAPAVADPRPAGRRSAGGGDAGPGATGRRPGTGGGLRDPHRHAGHPQPHPGGQVAPDPVVHAGRRQRGHARLRSAPGRTGPRGPRVAAPGPRGLPLAGRTQATDRTGV